MYALTRGGRFKYARTVLNQHGSQSMGAGKMPAISSGETWWTLRKRV